MSPDSWLFPVPLRGVGTEDIESLPSYFCRSAICHGVSVGKVFAHALEEHARRYPDEAQLYMRRRVWQHKVAPPRSMSRNPGLLGFHVRWEYFARRTLPAWITGTGLPELQSATFSALRHYTPFYAHQLFWGDMRWCPACFHEFLLAGDDGYYKLQWQLESVLLCAIHGVALEDRCPHCNADQNSWNSRVPARFCQRCKLNLGHAGNPEGIERTVGCRRHDKSNILLPMVREIAKNPELIYPSEGAHSVARSIQERTKEIPSHSPSAEFPRLRPSRFPRLGTTQFPECQRRR
ncbi:MAG: TniQ family protein [Proteobacteria bacterium]|nr:TniQ family protein [Pseudomonadota bacterium]